MGLFDDSRSGRLLTNDLAGTIGSILEEMPFSLCNVLCRHFRIGKGTYLRILHDKLGLKIPSSLGAACPIDQSEERNNVIFEDFLLLTALMEGRRAAFNGLSSCMNYGSYFMILLIRSGWVSCDKLPQRMKQKIGIKVLGSRIRTHLAARLGRFQ
jgi:hypothetical protein